MKNLILLILFLIVISYSGKTQNTAFVYRYQSMIDKFNSGFTTPDDFESFLKEIDEFERETEDETVSLKDQSLKQLLKNIKAIHSFVGELSPDGRNYDLTDDKLLFALNVFNLSETWFVKSKYCMDITRIDIWGGKYSAFLVKNDKELIVKFECVHNYGIITAGVGAHSSRSIYEGFNKAKSDGFKLKKLALIVYTPQFTDFPTF